ncbi:FecCD family ABC transporter permease [Nocardia paucivorans]|uniref:FecCD family ABC transporter permease n=1 Tax=Nocardia paucivorans TaxID=114259 RepID=UPI0002F62348|nr:iron ABC transporter permease [Nocardia paucivorans]
MTASLPETTSATSRTARVPAALRLGTVSLVWRPAMVAVVASLAATLFLLFCLHIAFGGTPLPPARVLEVLAGGGTRSQRFIVLESRLPRALTAVVVGIALGLAGAITQSVLHNPLAAPDVLGIGAGAGLGAVAVVVGAGGATTGLAAGLGAPAAAIAGGLLTAATIHLLSWGRNPTGDRGASGLRLVLIGVGANSLLLSGINWLLARSPLTETMRLQQWLTGSLATTSYSALVPAAVATAFVVAIALGSAHTLAALRLGADTTRVLGVRLHRRQALLIGAAVVGVSVATATAGPIAFVGLLAPQLARRLLRTPGEPLIGSALLGAIVMVGADLIARNLFPVELPVGIVTAAIGGPFLLLLLVHINRKATL